MGAFLFHILSLHLYMPDKIQQIQNEINELTAKNINEFRMKVRLILEKYGAKEPKTKPIKSCKI